MASFSWAKNADGDWNTAANWSPATVPNDPAADVAIDAPTTVTYGVTIAPTETVTVKTLTLNGTNNAAATNTPGYAAAKLEIDGTLQFAPGSAGTLDGPLQNFVVLNGGTIINPGTLNAFIQAQGNVLLTGTNGLYVTNWLQSLAGTVTIDTSSIAEFDAPNKTLFDGIFEAKGPGATINLGGAAHNLIVNIATIEGPPAIPDGWTEILFNDPSAAINEWTGPTTGYQSLEKTLTDIGVRGTVDVLAARGYNTSNTLAIDGGMLNIQGGTFTAAGLNINSGVVQGFATISGPVVNNSTLEVEGGTMVLTGSLSGTGQVGFDMDLKPGGSIIAGGGTLQVGAVGAGQTINMRGDDTLILSNAAAFAGTIVAQAGDKLALGSNVTSATLNNGILTVNAGAAPIASIHLVDGATSETYTANGGTITIGSTGTITPPPATSVFNDFNGDGKSDILWQNSPSGAVVQWQMNDTQPVASAAVGGDTNWEVVGTGDFYGDGKSDILWQDSSSGNVIQADMNGLQSSSMTYIGGSGGGWSVVGTGDFGGDGKSDILWQDRASGTVVQWNMNGSQVLSAAVIGGDSNWMVAGTGDFNGDGKSDILWQDRASGAVVQWDMNGSQAISSAVIGGDTTWKPISV